jgi:hypothetical protein
VRFNHSATSSSLELLPPSVISFISTYFGYMGDATALMLVLTDTFATAKLSVMGNLGIHGASDRLGVSTRQVQYLVARGDLRSIARGVIDDASVDRYLAARQESRRRAWSEATAWGAIGLLCGHQVSWMGNTQRSRLRTRLRSLAAEELVGRARGRAVTKRYASHSSAPARIAQHLVDTAEAAEALGLARTADIDGYVASAKAGALVAAHGLIRDDNGRVTLRETDMDLTVVAELAQSGPVLTALDLAESLDVRERAVGINTLGKALDLHRIASVKR